MRHNQGDIFTIANEAAQNEPVILAHGVNARGAAGGLARLVFEKYSRAWESYCAAIQPWRELPAEYRGGYHPMLGKIQLVRVEPNLTIANLWTQVEPGPDARQSAVMTCLNKLQRRTVEPIFIPLIGGGIGGLDPIRMTFLLTRNLPDKVTLVTLPTD